MSTTIWKFPIAITDEQTIEVPAVIYKVLHAGLDPSGVPCVWVVVDTASKMARSRLVIAIVGTGNPFPGNVAPSDHLGSFVQGSFVWHVFEVHR